MVLPVRAILDEMQTKKLEEIVLADSPGEEKTRVCSFVHTLLSDPSVVEPKDRKALENIYFHPSLSEEDKTRVFQVCLRANIIAPSDSEKTEAVARILSDITPDLKKDLVRCLPKLDDRWRSEEKIRCLIYLSQIGKSMFDLDLESLVEMINSSPEKEWIAVFHLTQDISKYNEVTAAADNRAILEQLKSWDDEKIDIHQAAFSIISHHTHPNMVNQIIQKMASLSKVERREICGFIHTVTKCSQISDSLDLLNKIVSLNPEKRREICTLAASFVGLYDPEWKSLKTIELVESLPDSEREGICIAALAIFEGNPYKTEDKLEMIKLVASFHKDSRKEMCQLIASVINSYTYKINTSGLTALVFESYSEWIPSVFQTIKTIIEIPESERKDICNTLLIFNKHCFKDKSQGSTTNQILQILKDCPLEKREWLSVQIASDLTTISEKLRKFYLELIWMIPKEDRKEENFIIISTLINQLNQPDIIQGIKNKLEFFPDTKRIEVMQAICELITGAHPLTPEIIVSRFFEIVLDSLPHIKENVYEYLIGEIDTETDRQKLRYIATNIIQFKEEWRLDEGHELFQKAIAAYINTDPRQLSDPKNPYVLFAKLKESESRPVVFSIPVEQYYSTTESGSMGEILFKGSVCLEPLISEAKTTLEGATFSKLPGDVKPTVLRELFQKIDTRIEALPVAERRAFLNHIKKSLAITYESLKNQILEDSYLKRLLRPTGSRDEIVPQDILQFFMILHSILEKADELETESLLSEFEVSFFVGKPKEAFTLTQEEKDKLEENTDLTQEEKDKLKEDVPLTEEEKDKLMQKLKKLQKSVLTESEKILLISLLKRDTILSEENRGSLIKKIKENPRLTPREEAFLHMATSIQGCPAGKREGIYVYYNMVSHVFTATRTTGEVFLKSQIYGMIDQLMKDLFSEDSPFMKQVTGETGEVKQLSHQATFLKNLIGKKVGLAWNITFDAHTRVLYDKLVSQKIEEVLATFLSHFTPKELIDTLHKEINRRLKGLEAEGSTPEFEEANTLYRALFEKLDSKTSLFSMTESSDGLSCSMSIKKEGVIALLEKFGYIKRIGT